MTKLEKILLGTTAAVLAALIAVAALLAINKYNDNKKFLKPPHEIAAIKGEPKKLDEDLKFNYIPVKDGFSVGICGNPRLSGDELTVYLTSPKTNKVWLRVLVCDENDNIIGESGMLYFGEYLKDIKLSCVPKEDCDIKLKILSYEPETYYSMGTVNATVKLKIEN